MVGDIGNAPANKHSVDQFTSRLECAEKLPTKGKKAAAREILSGLETDVKAFSDRLAQSPPPSTASSDPSRSRALQLVDEISALLHDLNTASSNLRAFGQFNRRFDKAKSYLERGETNEALYELDRLNLAVQKSLKRLFRPRRSRGSNKMFKEKKVTEAATSSLL